MEIYCDGDLPKTPARSRKVSFGRGTFQKPLALALTPHNQNIQSPSKKRSAKTDSVKKLQTQTSNNRGNNAGNKSVASQLQTTSVTPVMNKDSASVSSLRRTLRDTIFSPPSEIQSKQENVTPIARLSQRLLQSSEPTESHSCYKIASKTQDDSIRSETNRFALAPSFRRNAQQKQSVASIDQPFTLNSLLNTEMDIGEVDESLLISPNESKCMVLSLTDDTNESDSISPVVDKTLQKKQSSLSNRQDVRAFVKNRIAESKQNEPAQTVLAASADDPPGKNDCNGVRMDLSNMFSDISSPLSLAKESVLQTNLAAQDNTPKPHTSVPVACLANFHNGPWLDFGDERKNIVGKTRSLPLILEAPPIVKNCFLVEILKIPVKKGISLVDTEDHCKDENNSTTIWKLQAGEKKEIRIAWTPTEAGGVREIILLKLPRGSFQIVVHGHARKAKLKKASNSNIPARTPAQIKQLISKLSTPASDSQLTVHESSNGVSSAMHVTPSHFSTPRTSVFTKTKQIIVDRDDRSAEMQCAAFTKWLNYTFQPTEDVDHENALQKLKEEGNSIHSTNGIGLRTLILHQRMAQARMKASELFRSKEIIKTRKILEAEVSKGRLSLRANRDLHADLSLRGKIISLLLSYSTPWLRLGLETTFGETISPDVTTHFSPQKGSSLTRGKQKKGKVPLTRMKMALKTFMVDRLLTDPATLHKYTKGKCKVPSGNFEKKWRAERSKIVLNRLLVLIVYLDHAKQANLIESVPRLFTKGAEVKSSREVLVALCRDFLSSEGDIIKHLSRIGLKVHYKQTPADEIDFTIGNFAIDLRDGIRLARVVEILKEQAPKSLLKKLRLPAVSRLQKLHNVGVVLDTLRAAGVPKTLDIAAHHIVDGHREMVLKLMWSIVGYFRLGSLLKAELVENEIKNVLRANKSRRKSIKQIEGFTSCAQEDVTTDIFDTSDEEKLKHLLLRWCQAVCSCFGCPVANFTTSFADGKALCFLLHYYHPGLLKCKEILPTTRDLDKCVEDWEVGYEQALSQERQNSLLASTRMSDLGGIPKMLPVTDSQNVPDEKSMVLCLAYLCTRLMESSKEILATIAIQNCYRRYQRIVILEMKQAAALRILNIWRRRKDQYYDAQRCKYLGAVQSIEDFVVRFAGTIKALRSERLAIAERYEAAVKIQKRLRVRLAMNRVLPILRQNLAANRIQTRWRLICDRGKRLRLKLFDNASLIIQRYWRGYQARGGYSVLKASTLKLQHHFRANSARRKRKWLHDNATSIQRVWRGFLAQLRYQLDLLDIITVQNVARGRAALRCKQRRFTSIHKLQQAMRCFLAKRILIMKKAESTERKRIVEATIICQRAARHRLAIKQVHLLIQHSTSVALIQTQWRAYFARNYYSRMKALVISLQYLYRKFVGRQQLLVHRVSAITIQSVWRNYKTNLQYRCDVLKIITVQNIARQRAVSNELAKRRNSIVAIQGAARRWQAKEVVENLRIKHKGAIRLQAATVCQSIARRYLASHRVKLLLLCSQASILIQGVWRRHVARGDLLEIKAAALTIQAAYRGLLERHRVSSLSVKAIIIQSTWRCYWTKLQYQLDLLEIIIVQSVARRAAAHIETKKRKQAVFHIQKIVHRWRAVQHLKKKREWEIERKQLLTAALICQTLFRKKVACAELKSRANAVLCIQCAIRRCMAAQRVESLRIERKDAARAVGAKRRASVISLQACYRGYAVRRDLDFLGTAATSMQRIWRGYYAKLQYHMDVIDIILAQSIARCWVARSEVRRRKRAIVCIQQVTRIRIAVSVLESLKANKRELCKQYTASMLIQRNVRGMIGRMSFMRHQSARMIQKTWRCYIVHVDYMILMLSSIAIQAAARRFLTMRKYERMERGISVVQALVRGVAQRKSYLQTRSSSIIVQSCARTLIVSSTYQRKRQACILIQGSARGMLVRIDLQLKHFAASEIQRIWRGYQANVDFLIKVISAIKIQSCFRRCIAVNVAAESKQQMFLDYIDTLFVNKMVSKIQHAFGDYLYRKEVLESVYILQRAAKKFLANIEFQRAVRLIIQFQGVVRGRIVRCSRSKQARILAHRIDMVNARAVQNPKMQLGARTASALTVLQTSTRLAEIMVAVKTLEIATRLSEICCIAFAKANAPEVLYSLIRTCNRSLPHIELLHHILITLSNVTKHASLLPSVASDTSVDVFIDLIQMFRDKESVFCLAVSLLEQVVFSGDIYKMQCSSKENLKRLKGVHALGLRRMSISKPNKQAVSDNHAAKSRKQLSSKFELVDIKCSFRSLQRIISVLVQA